MKTIDIPHIHIGANGKVTGVLVNAWRSLTDARVGDELHLSTGSSVLEDCVVGSITFNERPFVFGSLMGCSQG